MDKAEHPVRRANRVEPSRVESSRVESSPGPVQLNKRALCRPRYYRPKYHEIYGLRLACTKRYLLHVRFFVNLFFPSLSPQFFRLQPSRAPLEDIEDNQKTHNSADKARQTKSAKRFFSLSSNKAIPFSCISLSLSFSLSLYIYIYRRGVNPTNYRPFSNQRLRLSFAKSVNREISLSS